MDQKRLFAAIALSIGILLLFDVYKRMNMPPEAPAPVTQQAQAPVPAVPAPAASGAPVPATQVLTAPSQQEAAPAARAPAQRIAIESAALSGNLNLRGARLDDLVLLRHRETTATGSRYFARIGPGFPRYLINAIDLRITN
jgi:YidC/Oxa1 family membrane protein insertase